MSANFTMSGKFYDFVENKKMCAMHMSSFCVLKCLEHRFLVPGKRFLVPEHMFWSQETAETRFLSHKTPPFNGYASPTLVTHRDSKSGERGEHVRAIFLPLLCKFLVCVRPQDVYWCLFLAPAVPKQFGQLTQLCLVSGD